MDEISRRILTALANLTLIGLGAGGLAVWAVAIRRLLERRPIVAYRPRRQVPWNGPDVLAILLGYVVTVSLLAAGTDLFFGWTPEHKRTDRPQPAEAAEKTTPPAGPEDEEKLDSERAHPIIVLLDADPSPAILVLCILSVIVMAPVGEEFLFRLLLQGYLEKVDMRCRRLWRYSGRLVGAVPVLLTSLLFAALHARDPREVLPPVDELIRLFAIDTLAKAVVVLGAILALRRFRRATWEDLGIRLDTLGSDLRLALATLAAIFIPIIALQFGLASWFPQSVPDPLPLFPLALALGYLYFRTHRIVPSLLLHLGFNASSMTMFFYFAWMADK